MAFSSANLLRRISGGFGTASNYDTGNVTAGATGTNTVTVNLSSVSGAPTLGYIRVRNYGLTTATMTTIDVKGTDGTTTVELAAIPAFNEAVAGRGGDFLIPFITELSLTQIIVIAKNTLGNTTMSTDVEVLSGP